MKALFTSKKFLAAIVCGAIAGVGKYLGWDAETIGWISGGFYAFIVGQGLADLGKEKAKLDKGT